MRLFRIVTGRHPVWSAEGARLHGGRWNARGQGVIYAALAYSTAMLEVLVHANRLQPPSASRHVVAEIPDGVAVERLDPALLPGWDAPEQRAAQAHGAQWWRERRTAVLLVPSVLSPFDWNAVIHADHPDSARIVAAEEAPVRWDPRLFPQK